MGKVLTPIQKADFARLSDKYLKVAEDAQRNLNALFRIGNRRWHRSETGGHIRRGIYIYISGKSRNHAILAFAAQWLKSKHQDPTTTVG